VHGLKIETRKQGRMKFMDERGFARLKAEVSRLHPSTNVTPATID
jgi:hypothetical protein